MKHGLTNTRIYQCWIDMKKRCYSSNNKSYKNYGARGIIVCDEWRNNFKPFYNWAMENGYTDKLTIERIDVNGNYEPSNCKWATRKEQGNNKRNNHFLTYNGETKSVSQWAEELGTKGTTIFNRVSKAGTTDEEVLSKPISHFHYITYNGETKTLNQWSKDLGINYRTLYDRIFEHNWDIQRAFSTTSKR